MLAAPRDGLEHPPGERIERRLDRLEQARMEGASLNNAPAWELLPQDLAHDFEFGKLGHGTSGEKYTDWASASRERATLHPL
jgi:hypothetical protein